MITCSADSPIEVHRGRLSVFAWVKGGKPGQVILSQSNGVNWLVADAGIRRPDDRPQKRDPHQLHAVLAGGHHRRQLASHRPDLGRDHRTLYVDGKLVARGHPGTSRAPTASLHIGTDKNLPPGSFWSGLIDDVRIYNRVVKP